MSKSLLRMTMCCHSADIFGRWAVSAYNGAAEGQRSPAQQSAREGEPFTGGTCPGRGGCPAGTDAPPQPAPIDNNNPPANGPAPPGTELPGGIPGYAALGDSYAVRSSSYPRSAAS